MEMDIIKGFPVEMTLIGETYSWTRKLDYEKISLHCRVCFETWHLATHCPKGSRKARNLYSKSTWWKESNEYYQIIDNETDLDPPKEGSKEFSFKNSGTSTQKDSLTHHSITKEGPSILDHHLDELNVEKKEPRDGEMDPDQSRDTPPKEDPSP